METEKTNWQFSLAVAGVLSRVGGITRREAASLMKTVEDAPPGSLVELRYERYNGTARALREDIKYWAMVEIPDKKPTEHEKQGSRLLRLVERLMGDSSRGEEWRGDK